jgi:hypothetical protein
MVHLLALLILEAAGLWLLAIALMTALYPAYCLHRFERMCLSLEAANWRLQLIEQGLRLLVGAALIVRAPDSRLPLAFEIAGWLLLVTSAIILLAPIRWHAGYGMWWTRRLHPWMIRLLCPLPAAAGIAIVVAAI